MQRKRLILDAPLYVVAHPAAHVITRQNSDAFVICTSTAVLTNKKLKTAHNKTKCSETTAISAANACN